MAGMVTRRSPSVAWEIGDGGVTAEYVLVSHFRFLTTRYIPPSTAPPIAYVRRLVRLNHHPYHPAAPTRSNPDSLAKSDVNSKTPAPTIRLPRPIPTITTASPAIPNKKYPMLSTVSSTASTFIGWTKNTRANSKAVPGIKNRFSTTSTRILLVIWIAVLTTRWPKGFSLNNQQLIVYTVKDTGRYTT